ncbi:hypothetical protein [Pelagibius sp.]|uniref:hypothetical protein n=1 Tax=Pelagibius sp. TaxID=1931238 RepID=UPI003B50F3F2
MATPTLSTGLSRRAMLAGGAAIAIPTAAPLAALAARVDGDTRVAMLAERYRQATDALVGWIAEAERRDGPFAYNEPEYSARYRELVALGNRCTLALAEARPSSIRGLVLKLRPAFYCDTLRKAQADCDTTILLPALHDLERLAEEAGTAKSTL